MSRHQLLKGDVDIVEYTKTCLAQAKDLQNKYSLFTCLDEQSVLAQAHHLQEHLEQYKDKSLFGVMVSVKDAICVKEVESRAGSTILKGYKPVFNATVINRIQAQGGIIIGKTAQDEFGFGSFSVNTDVIPKNPHDTTRSCGGSSGGAGGITAAAEFEHIALGESTGGSIASPASFCGVFGLTPTYGRVSRYGLMDFGNSLDKIGPMGKTISDVEKLYDVIKGHDANDSTSVNTQEEHQKEVKVVGVITETFQEGVSPKVKETVNKAIETLKEQGITVKELSLSLAVKNSLATYYILATSEASTNLSKYCGMRYGVSKKLEGNFNEYFTSVRSNEFTSEAKRRIMLGTFARMSGFRDAYYIKAAKVRTKIIEEYKQAFKECDVLVSPTTPVVAPKFEDIDKMTPLQHYAMDVSLVGPNIAGLPHLNIPVGKVEDMPVGMLAIGDHFHEKTLLEFGRLFE